MLAFQVVDASLLSTFCTEEDQSVESARLPLDCWATTPMSSSCRSSARTDSASFASTDSDSGYATSHPETGPTRNSVLIASSCSDRPSMDLQRRTRCVSALVRRHRWDRCLRGVHASKVGQAAVLGVTRLITGRTKWRRPVDRRLQHRKQRSGQGSQGCSIPLWRTYRAT